MTYLRPCIESHQPLDLIIVMLGTNDLKRRFDLSASDIAQSAAGLAEHGVAVRPRGPMDRTPEVLLVAPPAVTTLTEFDQMFDRSAREIPAVLTLLPVGRGMASSAVLRCRVGDRLQRERRHPFRRGRTPQARRSAG